MFSSVRIFGSPFKISFSRMSASQPIQFLSDLWHLLPHTTPKLLRCNDSFVNPSHRMHPTQKFARRRRHDLTSAQVRTPPDFVSHQSQEIPGQHMDRKMRMCSELHPQVVQPSSIRPMVHHLLPLILFC